MIQLKGDHVTLDPRLDRVPQWDRRNESFPIRPLLGVPVLRERSWRCLSRLDQGREGACVGFGWSHELAAEPVHVPVSNVSARGLYHRAQQLDEWPGEGYEGTSVLAGAKAVQEAGHMAEYRWALNLPDVLATISAYGPVVIGVDWHEGQMRTDARGYITPTGPIMGGHCTLLRGLIRENRRWVTVGRNSWGADWGIRGDFKLAADDLGALLANGGEACVPVRRS